MSKVRIVVYTIAILLLVTYTYPLIGLWGQIKPAEYPSTYQETNNYLNQQNITGYIIYYPWHLYLTYNWTEHISSDGRIANPINKLIQEKVEVSPGSWGTKTNTTNQIQNCQTNLTCLENIGVEYILRDKCTAAPTPIINKTPVHQADCIDIYKLDNKIQIDRSATPPLRFWLGTIISAITLIACVGYLLREKYFGAK